MKSPHPLLMFAASAVIVLVAACTMPVPVVTHEHSHELGAARSSCWPTARAEYIAAHPVCEACGGKHGVQVHHKRPFNLDTLPDGSHPHECDQSNLISLCTGETMNCHLWIGHAGNFKNYNPNVEQDAKRFRDMLANRKENKP